MVLRGCLALLLFAVAAAAEEGDRVDDLERRVEALEKDKQQAQQERDALKAEIENYLAKEEGLGLAIVLRRGNVLATIQIFGDVGAGYRNPSPPGKGNSSFFLGQANLFATAQIGERIQVMSETVVKTSAGTASDSINFDQERLWLSYAFGDLLTIKLGLEHGPISRWNRIYHHGRWLEMSIERPFLAQFESSGILPLHNSGVEFSGRVRTDAGAVEYIFLVSNGRGRVATDPQKVFDRKDDKALEISISFVPTAVEGLRVGGGFRWDEIPPNPDDPARTGTFRQIIASAYVEFRRGPFEVIAEIAWVEDRDRATMTTFGHHLAYIQVAYHLDDRWTPYTRFDSRQMETGDPYYAPLGRDTDIWEWLLGLRHELADNAALKIEIAYGREDVANGGGGVRERGYIRFGVQISWVF